MSTPNWAFDLLIAVQRYEDSHGSISEGAFCFEGVLKSVPRADQDIAEAIRQYKLQERP